MYKPNYMKKWQRVPDYGGEDLSEWYILTAQTRDSFLLDRTNFEDIKAHIESQGFEIAGNLEDCKKDGAVLLASFGHWACGWIESLMIHQDNDKALILGDEIVEKLDNYPIFDEESFSQAEYSLIEEDVKRFFIEDYLNDEDIELTESQVDSVLSDLMEKIDFELNGYDEVIPNIEGAKFDNIRDKAINRAQNLKTCPKCKKTFDKRSESCDCQMTLL